MKRFGRHLVTYKGNNKRLATGCQLRADFRYLGIFSGDDIVGFCTHAKANCQTFLDIRRSSKSRK